MNTFRLAAAVLLLALSVGTYAQPRAASWTPPSYDENYVKTWHDGNAELASYTLTYPRYGELRTGTAVMVTVTEPFDPTARVKADALRDDTYSVIKLNLAEDFQTGVYDYNLMTSVFVATESANGLPPGSPTKVSFSSQEWCGHVYQQALFGQTKPGTPSAQQTSHSYFEGEADQHLDMEHPQSGLAEDALILWARGLAGPALKPGESIDVPMYRSLAVQRLQHVRAQWDRATLSVRKDLTPLRTASGEDLAVRIYDATVFSDVGDRQYTFYIDSHRRLMKMTRNDGYELELIDIERLPYWRLHDNADERELKKIGLTRRQPAAM